MAHLFESINPANDEQLATYEASSADQVKMALGASSRTSESWSRQSYEERSRVLKSVAAKIREQKSELARLATREMGKPIQQSTDELEKCARTLDYYANEGPAMLADQIVATDARKSYVSFQPLGTVLAIMPWNFPYWQVLRCAAPILLAGNVMLLKHASNVSGCALAIERIFREAGAPEGLFQTLLLPSSEMENLIADPGIHAVTFTGSTKAGSQVAAAAGKAIKKQVLELGGSDAYVVLKDADLKPTIKICSSARLVNSGQSCVAAKRFIVAKEILEEFEQGLVASFEQVKWGKGALDREMGIGPMARRDLRESLHKQVQESIAKGARLLCGGYIPEGPGAFYPPTILSNVSKGMPAYDEELFGPVAAIIEASDEQEAIRIANDSEYGLGAAIFSRNIEHAEELAARELQAGSCFVNAQVHSDPRMPFGGVKHSGYGRELGLFGLREFTNIKTVMVH